MADHIAKQDIVITTALIGPQGAGAGDRGHGEGP